VAKLDLSPHLTCGYSETLEHQFRSTHCGQAYFGNTGPFGATCGEYTFLGYFQQHRNKAGDTVKMTYRGGCQKFFQLTGQHGAIVPANAPACRYFERQESKTTTDKFYQPDLLDVPCLFDVAAMKRHVEYLLSSYRNARINWLTDINGACVKYSHDREPLEIHVPLIRSAICYAAALHEIGHICGRYQQSRHVRTRERWAWKWARRNAIIWMPEMEGCARSVMFQRFGVQWPACAQWPA
jgi:hypothetical protein